MVDGEAAGDLVVDVFGEDLLLAELVGIGIGTVIDNGASHGRGYAGKALELWPSGGVDVDALVGGVSREAITDAENGGLGAAGDGSGGVGSALADALLTAWTGRAAEGEEQCERSDCRLDLHA